MSPILFILIIGIVSACISPLLLWGYTRFATRLHLLDRPHLYKTEQ